MAELAPSAALDSLAKKEAQKSAETEASEKEWADNARRLEGATITVSARANDIGHLYTKLPLELITKKIKEELGIIVPEDALMLNAPLKALGETKVEVRRGKSSATFTVAVIKMAP